MRDVSSLEKILVLDFGAQYAHLICRRIRELGVYAELAPYDISREEIAKRKGIGIVLSGGPKSVYSEHAPLPSEKLYDAGLPILGICYGLQAIIYQQGGKVKKATRREYGKSDVRFDENSPLFSGIEGPTTTCWMSHGDSAESLPMGFASIASTTNSPYAAITNGRLYAVQFHPEVSHTQEGMKILENFVFKICHGSKNWTAETMIDEMISEINGIVAKSDKVLCALSGGIDSATTAIILQKAIGARLLCVFVDHGLLRKNERERVEEIFGPLLGNNLIIRDDSRIFLRKLKGVSDPERKRRIIGREFIRSFTEASKQLGHIDFLAQGTLYTDIIESAAGASKHESKIKSHHNVGGLPKRLGFKLVEPLKDLYKDEVRKVAMTLGLPKDLVETHPFPGPGLAVRIIGSVTEEKLRICRESNSIVEEEIAGEGLRSKVWQSFAFVGDDLATGVLGDERSVGHIVIVRVVQSTDGMTADWTRLSHELLERISNRITNEVPGVTWVAYAISSKPPSTIEPQ